MKEQPSLSIIIPSWNQGQFIERTLLSILKQEYKGQLQIIVSDGGSTDNTVDILKKYDDKIVWWSAKDKGFVDAVMKGAAKATGEIQAIQSSDDYYLPGAFEKMASVFAQYPDAGFVSGGECSIDLDGNIVEVSHPAGAITPESILFDTIPPQHSSFIKRSLFEEVGGLRGEVDMCADIDLWYRASHLQNGVYFSDVISCYQLHPNQRTAVSDKWHPNLVKMVEMTEQEPRYGTIFSLNPSRKKDLFSYWEMNWNFKRDPSVGRKIARQKAKSVLSQSYRTNRLMAGILFSDAVKRSLKIKKSAALVSKNEMPGLYENLEWYKRI